MNKLILVFVVLFSVLLLSFGQDDDSSDDYLGPITCTTNQDCVNAGGASNFQCNTTAQVCQCPAGFTEYNYIYPGSDVVIDIECVDLVATNQFLCTYKTGPGTPNYGIKTGVPCANGLACCSVAQLGAICYDPATEQCCIADYEVAACPIPPTNPPTAAPTVNPTKPPGDKTPIFTISFSGNALTLGSTGTNLTISALSLTNPSQQWFMNSTGYIFSAVPGSTQVLDVTNSAITSGSPVSVWHAKAGSNQFWNFQSQTPGGNNYLYDAVPGGLQTQVGYLTSVESNLYLKYGDGKWQLTDDAFLVRITIVSTF